MDKVEEIFEQLPDNPTERLTAPMRQLIASKHFRFDVHTHIFSGEYIPDKYYGIRNPYVVNPDFLEYIEDVLTNVKDLEINDDQLLHYAYFIDFAKKNTSENIFKYLISNSLPNTIFVTIAMDLEQSIDGKASKGYLEQLEMTSRLYQKYPQQVLPFFELNPSRKNWLEVLELALVKYKFFGIKIYPSFGYLPSHPNLMRVFELCEAKDIPVITHCGTDGAHLARNFLNIKTMLEQEGSLVTKSYNKVFLFKSQFVKYFNKPQNWEIVLKTFPKLRLNFAHFGGDEDWDGNMKNDRQWTLRIIELMERYENVYADVSYIYYLPTMPRLFKKLILKNSIVAERSLWGSDFYMINTRGKYKELRTRIFTELGSKLMFKISVLNPLRYLGLSSLVTQNNHSNE